MDAGASDDNDAGTTAIIGKNSDINEIDDNKDDVNKKEKSWMIFLLLFQSFLKNFLK